MRWRLRTARSGTATGTFPSRSRARARRHAHRSHPNSSRRGRNPLHAAQKTVDGRAAPLFVGSLPAALAPFPIDPRRHFRLLHLTPAGSHHLCLALMARYTPIDRSRSVTRSPAERVHAWSPKSRGFNSITRSLAVRCPRVWCTGVATLTSRRLRRLPPWPVDKATAIGPGPRSHRAFASRRSDQRRGGGRGRSRRIPGRVD